MRIYDGEELFEASSALSLPVLPLRVSKQQISLWGGKRLQMNESIEMTLASLNAYGPGFRHWAIAWSGGKDSTALVTFVVWAILAGKVAPPASLTVLYADTRMELLPLWIAAEAIREELRANEEALAKLGVKLDVVTVIAPLDKRFLVYMLGRGVPPPNNRTMRWCTRQIKIDPMAEELRRVRDAAGEKLLVLTGVRQGESAIRDGRIAMSCGRDGGECGQGWYQQTLPGALCDTLAPLLQWRVCHVWEWLKRWAPSAEFGDWTTEPLADAYGGDEAEEINARTGCVGCPLAEEDKGLEAVLAQPKWAYLAPLRGLRGLYRELRTPVMRLRKPGGDRRADGSLTKNQQRMGPLTLEARRAAFRRILAIQAEINAAAEQLERPPIDILNAEECARIEELITRGTWPDKWTGNEPRADVEMDVAYADGTVQPLLWNALRGSR